MSATTAQSPVFPAPQPPYLKLIGKFFSYVFHPLFIPLYVSAYLIFIHPYSFAVLDEKQKQLRLLSIFVITVFFPALTVFLLWRLGFSTSIYLRTQKERIVPYISSIIYFFWAFYVSKNLSGTPEIMTSFFLGIFLTLSLAVMANNYFKISMHAMAVGGAATFMVLLAFVNGETSGMAVSVSLLVAGMVCTSRLLVSDHSPYDIYWGLIIAGICQVVACIFIM